jgi:hypothetical protein
VSGYGTPLFIFKAPPFLQLPLPPNLPIVLFVLYVFSGLWVSFLKKLSRSMSLDDFGHESSHRANHKQLNYDNYPMDDSHCPRNTRNLLLGKVFGEAGMAGDRGLSRLKMKGSHPRIATKTTEQI